MFFKNVTYITSAPSKQYWPQNDYNEFLFLGKSNVGKSSLINALCNNNTIAKTSSVPGHTKYLNFFDVNKQMRLVDSPGYGYAQTDKNRTETFGKMMEEYLFERENLRGAALLIDSRRIPDDADALLFNMLIDAKVPFIIIATKCDKLTQSEKSKVTKNIIERFKIKNPEIIYYSGFKTQSTYDKIINFATNICSK